ncbi:UDP-3-O-acyl-N-acetylglucosamine deacetylase [Acidobacteriia bacterium AH_259_A11_L15]|nr:UDP-3-O-acyl-N-acetylglucosamine deacetylase [Acidobacteriia bacterium AH_259_A11_L15]
MVEFEHTIERPAAVGGIGLHTGVSCQLSLLPAPSGTGVLFRRVDLDGFQVEARAANIARVSYATSLMKKGVLISTTEHLLAALYAVGIDNVIVELDNLELPILDGSARPFLQLIESAGRKRQRRRRRYLQILQPVEVSEGEPGSEKFRGIGVYPANGAAGLAVDYTIDFRHPLIGCQRLDFELNAANFARLLSDARTFCFYNEVEQLRAMGLIRGGSLECAVVLTGEGLMNSDGLRHPDEFCRHKTLDLIGDLALVGRPLVGRVVASRAGHALHTALVLKLLRMRSAWREVTAAELSRNGFFA